MGLLDPTLLTNLNKLKGLLGETPIGKYVRGQDQGVSVNGLKQALLGMPVFDQQTAMGDMQYAADAIGPTAIAGTTKLVKGVTGKASLSFNAKDPYALYAHVTLPENVASIKKQGLRPGKSGTSYWWPEGPDEAAMAERLGYDRLQDAVVLGTEKQNLKNVFDDDELLGAYAVRAPHGVEPEKLFMWADDLKKWVPLLDGGK